MQSVARAQAVLPADEKRRCRLLDKRCRRDTGTRIWLACDPRMRLRGLTAPQKYSPIWTNGVLVNAIMWVRVVVLYCVSERRGVVVP